MNKGKKGITGLMKFYYSTKCMDVNIKCKIYMLSSTSQIGKPFEILTIKVKILQFHLNPFIFSTTEPLTQR